MFYLYKVHLICVIHPTGISTELPSSSAAQDETILDEKACMILAWALAPHFCLVNVSPYCAMVFLPKTLLCHHVVLPVSSLCSSLGGEEACGTSLVLVGFLTAACFLNASAGK